MLKLSRNELPNAFKTKFMKTVNIYSHETRKPNQLNHFFSCVYETACQPKLNYRGVMLWYEIKDKQN